MDGGIAEDSKWQTRWEKLVCMTTQRYDTPSREVKKIFFGIMSIELYRFRARKWNDERVIFFSPLSSNAPKASTIPRKFKRAFYFDLTCGIMERLTSS